MHVAVTDNRLAMSGSPAFSAAIEIERARVHRIALDGVEQVGVPLEIAAKARRVRKERVRRDHQAALARLQLRQVGKRTDLVGAAAEIEQQHMAAFDRPLDAGNQHDVTFRRMGLEPAEIELLLVERDRNGVVAKIGSAIDQVERRMGNRVDRVVAGVGMELNLQHRTNGHYRIRAGACLRQINNLAADGRGRAEMDFQRLSRGRHLSPPGRTSAAPAPLEYDARRGMKAIDFILRLALATGLGAALGLEREMRQKPAGLRTNMLIAVGSALFSLISVQLAGHGGTPDRIAANIVTGVGFLGGGAILRSGREVLGMTTAATIWVNAAIGMAAGFGESTLAISATGITLMVLGVLPPIERYFDRRTQATPEHMPEH